MIAAATPPYLLLLLVTIVVESAIALVLVRGKRRRLRLDVPLLNCLTHPFATVLLRWGWITFWPAELCIWLVEAFGYRTVTGLRTSQALALSGICNAATALIAIVWT